MSAIFSNGEDSAINTTSRMAASKAINKETSFMAIQAAIVFLVARLLKQSPLKSWILCQVRLALLLEQKGQSFRVKGDPVVEAAPEQSIKITNVTRGHGNKVSERGDTISVKYVGTLNDGTQFDAANDFSFTLGAGDVIKGWDQGLLGMKVGAKRQLVVPPKLGYGKRGCAPDIPPNATLHFDVTMKKITKG